MILLMICAIVSIVLGVRMLENVILHFLIVFPERPEDRSIGWIEGVAIITAVFLVAAVTSVNNWSKERKFRVLNKQNENIDVSVLRGAKNMLVKIGQIVVGDVVNLETGDAVPADGVLFESYELQTDESSLTGESHLVHKNLSSDPYVLSNCKIGEGRGKMIVTAVGVNSSWGKMLTKINKEDEEDRKTPLEIKLEKVAKLIGKIGVGVAVFTFFALVIAFIVKKSMTNGIIG